MPFSKNLNTYHDVVQVLTTARQAGGAVYVLETVGQATNWVARAYFYRKLLADTARRRAGSVPGFVPSTEWDDMLLLREGNSVRIQFGKVKGRILDAEGHELPPVEVPVEHGLAEHIIETVPLREPKPSPDNSPPDVALDDLEAAAAELLRKNS